MANLIDINVDIAFTNNQTIRYYDNSNVAFNIAGLVSMAPALQQLRANATTPTNPCDIFKQVVSSFVCDTTDDTELELKDDEIYRVRLSFVFDDCGNFEYHGSSKGEVPIALVSKLWNGYMQLIEKLKRV